MINSAQFLACQVWRGPARTWGSDAPSSPQQCGKASGIVDGDFPYWVNGWRRVHTNLIFSQKIENNQSTGEFLYQYPAGLKNGLNWIYISQWFKLVLTSLNCLKLIKGSLNRNAHCHQMIHFIQNMPGSDGMKRSEKIPLIYLLMVDSDEVKYNHT